MGLGQQRPKNFESNKICVIYPVTSVRTYLIMYNTLYIFTLFSVFSTACKYSKYVGLKSRIVNYTFIIY